MSRNVECGPEGYQRLADSSSEEEEEEEEEEGRERHSDSVASSCTNQHVSGKYVCVCVCVWLLLYLMTLYWCHASPSYLASLYCTLVTVHLL